jgi:hypothetical protein
MKTEKVQTIEARIRELDDLLWGKKEPEPEMTEGWLSNTPEMAELEALYHEREELLEQLAKEEVSEEAMAKAA